MLLTGLLPLLASDPAVAAAADSIAAGRSGALVAPSGLRAPIAAHIASRATTPVVVLTATGREAEAMTAALASWTTGAAAFPAWETLPHERLSPQVDTLSLIHI